MAVRHGDQIDTAALQGVAEKFTMIVDATLDARRPTATVLHLSILYSQHLSISKQLHYSLKHIHSQAHARSTKQFHTIQYSFNSSNSLSNSLFKLSSPQLKLHWINHLRIVD